MRRLSITVFIVYLFCISCNSAVNVVPKFASPELQFRMEATVRVMGCPSVTADGSVNYHIGTGIAVSPTKLITAAHVFTCKDPFIGVLMQDESRKLFKIDKIDYERDIATATLVQGGEFKVWAKVATRDKFSIGEQLCAVAGAGHALAKVQKCGAVIFNDNDYIAINMRGKLGNSGGPIFDKNGNVVAIIRGTTDDISEEDTVVARLLNSAKDFL